MGYELVITERAEELLDGLVAYRMSGAGGEPAAAGFLDGVEQIYGCLEQDPLQFPASCDGYLAGKGYRAAAVPGSGGVVVFRVAGHTVVVLGFFCQAKDFRGRLLQ